MGVERDYPVVCLLPGSREDEVGNLLPAMVESVEILRRSYPGIRCLLPLAPTIQLEFVQALIKDSPVEIRVFQGDIHLLLSVCHVAIVTSCTATLETAISGTPMVVVYKMSALSYLVGRLIIKTPYISLVNLVAGEEVVTELIQDDVIPDRIADEVLNILDCTDVRENMIKKLKNVSQHLGRGGPSERVAEIALEMMV